MYAPLISSDQSPSELFVEVKGNVLARLSNYHFSPQSLPTKSDSLKKYFFMSIAAGGGLAYWGVTDAYNSDHGYSKFIATNNLVGVTVSAGLFLLQSVDLAKELINELAGTVPDQLADILEVPSAIHRQKIMRRTFFGSSISGVPFLIIALISPLPPIASIQSDRWRKAAVGLWGAYIYSVNVGLHILPIAILQSPQFSYYRPSPLVCFNSTVQSTTEAPTLEQEIASLDIELKADYNVPKDWIAGRLTSSLNQLIQKITDGISLSGYFDDRELNTVFEHQGLDRLLYLLKQYPPTLAVSGSTSVWKNRAIRLFGAQLELGAGFTWWTNVFPALFQSLRQAGTNVALSYTLAALFGSLPSYTLIVILAFFGEMQIPRLVDYLINAGKKLTGYNKDFRLLPAEAKLNPPLWLLMTGATAWITAFSSVNAKSVNEQLYQDSFSGTFMTVLEVYADAGISIMTFMALMDLYYRYQKEISAAFGSSESHSHKLAHFLLILENLPKNIRRVIPATLMQELKQLPDEKLQVLLGAGKGLVWLKDHEQKIMKKETRLVQKKAEQKEISKESQPETKEALQAQSVSFSPSSDTGNFFRLSQCLSAVFSGFSCCRRRRQHHEPLLGKQSNFSVSS